MHILSLSLINVSTVYIVSVLIHFLSGIFSRWLILTLTNIFWQPNDLLLQQFVYAKFKSLSLSIYVSVTVSFIFIYILSIIMSHWDGQVIKNKRVFSYFIFWEFLTEPNPSAIFQVKERIKMMMWLTGSDCEGLLFFFSSCCFERFHRESRKRGKR